MVFQMKSRRRTHNLNIRYKQTILITFLKKKKQTNGRWATHLCTMGLLAFKFSMNKEQLVLVFGTVIYNYNNNLNYQLNF